MLGIAVVMFSIFSMWTIFSGVGQSRILPDRPAFTGAGNAYFFITILPVLGLGAIVHGGCKSKTSEWVWGVIVFVWGFFSFWWVGWNISEGSAFFKSSVLGELSLTSWPLMVFVVQGLALFIDGAFEEEDVE
jgi:hypothetical protein